jgi:hypothetical protein
MTDELNHEIEHRHPDNASRDMGHGALCSTLWIFQRGTASFCCLGCYRFSGERVLKKYSQDF